MPINTTGPISLGGPNVGESVNLQLGKASDATISMNDADVRALAQKSVAGQTISFFDFYGKPVTPSPTPAVSSTPAVSPSRTPSETPAVTPSITPQPTPSRTPAVTPTPSPLPFYIYTIEFISYTEECVTTVGGDYVSKVQLSVFQTYWSNDFAQCFVVTAYVGETFNTAQINTVEAEICNSTRCFGGGGGGPQQ